MATSGWTCQICGFRSYINDTGSAVSRPLICAQCEGERPKVVEAYTRGWEKGAHAKWTNRN